MNKGERDELIFKFVLISLRDRNQTLFNVPVNSVGFLDTEYKSLPENIELNNIIQLNDIDLLALSSIVGISKAPSGAKSDVYINGKGVSLKSLSAAPSALVNHTSRPGFEFACINSDSKIEELDKIIDKYWELRMAGIIKEDVKNTDLNCPFLSHKEYMRPIIEYFLFKGTGSKICDTQAQYIIEFSNPLDSNTYKKLLPLDAVDAVWPKLIFSLRAKKGMPKNYNPDEYEGPNAESIKKWVRFHSGDYRGALHIRTSK